MICSFALVVGTQSFCLVEPLQPTPVTSHVNGAASGPQSGGCCLIAATLEWVEWVLLRKCTRLSFWIIASWCQEFGSFAEFTYYLKLKAPFSSTSSQIWLFSGHISSEAHIPLLLELLAMNSEILCCFEDAVAGV